MFVVAGAHEPLAAVAHDLARAHVASARLDDHARADRQLQPSPAVSINRETAHAPVTVPDDVGGTACSPRRHRCEESMSAWCSTALACSAPTARAAATCAGRRSAAPASFPYEVRELYGILPYADYVAQVIEWCGGPASARVIDTPLASYLQPGYRDALAGKIELTDGADRPVELPDSNCLIVVEKR